MTLLPPNAAPPLDLIEFLEALAFRLGMVRRGRELDVRRAAVWFIHWWREKGGLVNHISLRRHGADPLEPTGTAATASSHGQRISWGLDFEWDWDWGKSSASQPVTEELIQDRMEKVIAEYLVKMEEEEHSPDNVSVTQERKRLKEEKSVRRLAAARARNKNYFR